MKIPEISLNKIIAWLIIIIILVIIIIFINKTIKKLKQNKQDKDLVKESEQAIVLGNLTYTEADYKAMADKLYIAMKGIGTDEEAIYEVIGRLRTRSDWYALVKAFGIRKSGSFSGNLVQWLSDELDETERARVNYILQKFDIQI